MLATVKGITNVYCLKGPGDALRLTVATLLLLVAIELALEVLFFDALSTILPKIAIFILNLIRNTIEFTLGNAYIKSFSVEDFHINNTYLDMAQIAVIRVVAAFVTVYFFLKKEGMRRLYVSIMGALVGLHIIYTTEVLLIAHYKAYIEFSNTLLMIFSCVSVALILWYTAAIIKLLCDTLGIKLITSIKYVSIYASVTNIFLLGLIL